MMGGRPQQRICSLLREEEAASLCVVWGGEQGALPKTVSFPLICGQFSPSLDQSVLIPGPKLIGLVDVEEQILDSSFCIWTKTPKAWNPSHAPEHPLQPDTGSAVQRVSRGNLHLGRKISISWPQALSACFLLFPRQSRCMGSQLPWSIHSPLSTNSEELFCNIAILVQSQFHCQTQGRIMKWLFFNSFFY